MRPGQFKRGMVGWVRSSHTRILSDLSNTCATCTPYIPHSQHFPPAFRTTVALTEAPIPADDGQTFERFLGGGQSSSSPSSEISGPSDSEAGGDTDLVRDGGLEERLVRGLLEGSRIGMAECAVWRCSSMVFSAVFVRSRRARSIVHGILYRHGDVTRSIYYGLCVFYGQANYPISHLPIRNLVLLKPLFLFQFVGLLLKSECGEYR